MRYGRLLENGQIEYAPKTLVVDGRPVSNSHMTDRQAQGWYPVIDRPPRLSVRGKVWEPRERRLINGVIRRNYVLVDKPADPPPPPRVFVTADLVEQLMQSGVWEQARAWIVEQGMLDLVLATKEFDETNENFLAGKTALQSALGWTDEEVEELLAKCVKEDV